MPKPAMLPRASLTILCALGLTACGQKDIRLSPLPAELTSCAAEPEAPALPAYRWGDIEMDAAMMPTPAEAAKRAVELAEAQALERDRKVLDYALRLRSWGGDCEAKIKGAAAWNRTVSGQTP